jgi:hypothetical protein
MRAYNGGIHPLYDIREKREESFLQERDRRPETRDFNWRDLSKSTVRKALGHLIGEVPLQEAQIPAIVPS